MVKTQIRGIGISLFLAGIFVLVGYAMYVGFLSGEKMGAYTIQEFDGSTFSLVGFSVSKGTAKATHTVGPIAFSPEMNPVGVVLSIKQRGGGSSIGHQGVKYEFELLDQRGNRIWKKLGAQSDSDDDSSSKSTSIALGSFEVEQAGEYMLMCDLNDERSFKPIIINAQVVFRRNVARANKQVYLVSGVFALVGFVVMISTSEKKSV